MKVIFELKLLIPSVFINKLGDGVFVMLQAI